MMAAAIAVSLGLAGLPAAGRSTARRSGLRLVREELHGGVGREPHGSRPAR